MSAVIARTMRSGRMTRPGETVEKSEKNWRMAIARKKLFYEKSCSVSWDARTEHIKRNVAISLKAWADSAQARVGVHKCRGCSSRSSCHLVCDQRPMLIMRARTAQARIAIPTSRVHSKLPSALRKTSAASHREPPSLKIHSCSPSSTAHSVCS